MGSDVVKRLGDAQVLALRCQGDAWPRSLLSATPIPAPWMGLVIRRDGRRRLVPAGEDPRPASDDTLVLVRNQALAVPLGVVDCPATDHPVCGTVELLLRCAARDHDLAAFQATLLTSGELTVAALADAVRRAGAEAALRQFIRPLTAAQLLHEDWRAVLGDILRDALQRFLFSSGLTLEGIGRLEFSSESYAQQDALQRAAARRIEEIKSRDMVEQAATAATYRRLDEMSGLFSKLKQVAGDDTGRWGELLPALTPVERGRLLENLWRVTPDQCTARAIVVVAGYGCSWLDPVRPERVVQRMTLEASLGGLRSVGFCRERGWLLVGAARGVWVLSADDGAVVGRYEVPDAGQPRTGFNAAVVAGDHLWATHSQLGCWCWPLPSPADAAAILRPVDGKPKAVRGVTAGAGGQVLFAADDCVYFADAPGAALRATSPVTATITCLATVQDEVYAGTADGRVWNQNPHGHPGLADADVWSAVHRAGSALESIVARCWSGLVELVIPAGADGVCGVYGEAGVAVRLMEATTPIRRVWACDDAIVALNENRDRLVVLHASMPGRAGRPVALARELGGLIQDACIVTAAEVAPGNVSIPPGGVGVPPDGVGVPPGGVGVPPANHEGKEVQA